MNNFDKIEKFLRISIENLKPFVLESNFIRITAFTEENNKFFLNLIIEEKEILQEEKINSFVFPKTISYKMLHPEKYDKEFQKYFKNLDGAATKTYYFNRNSNYDQYSFNKKLDSITNIVFYLSKIDKLKGFL